MKKSYFVFLIFAVLIIGVYAAWNIAYPSGTWRYKMTVTVETPEGIKTGSAVREVYIYREPQLWQTTAGHAHLTKGEAVVVDLGERGVLFALMRGEKGSVDYGHMIFVNTFTGGKVTKDAIINAKQHLSVGQKVALTIDKYPMFAWYTDYRDRTSIHEGSGYLELAFGKGVKLKEITIEVTNEPVTHKISPYLPKFDGKQKYLNMWDFKKDVR